MNHISLYMNLFDQFFDGREDFLAVITAFEIKREFQFISKLKRETNSANFLSTITEIRFGLFFEEICQQLQYDGEIYGKRPDYLVEINSQKILIEVARLNPTENDKRQLDFESAFMTALEEITVGCLLAFDYKEDEIDYYLTDFSAVKSTCEQWLQTPRRKGDQLKLVNKIVLTYKYASEKYSHLCLIGGGGSVNFDYRRLDGPKSSLIKKCMKYGDIISDHKLPYIVCIYLDFHTWFSTRDLYPRLYGMRVSDYGYNEDLIPFTCLDDALYYSSLAEIKNVTGILVCQSGEFSYFHNYGSKVKLNSQNLDLMLKWQYHKD